MKNRMLMLTLLLVSCLSGCGRKSAEQLSPENLPLTMEKWQTLPPNKKYEIETFERLKLGNAKLQEDQEWNRFARNVMLPAKRRELPSTK